jgi:hypothetical protein
MEPHPKYNYERLGFIKRNGEQEILKQADALAEFTWFSKRKCITALKPLTKPQRDDAFKLLRAAQFSRHNPQKESSELWYRAQMSKKGEGFFDLAETRPAAYFKPIQRIEVAGEFAGVTVRSERVSGGKIRVYYSSKHSGLKLKKIELRDQACEYLKSKGLHVWQAVFQCEKAVA